jgi:hypothetical protein
MVVAELAHGVEEGDGLALSLASSSPCQCGTS